MRIQESLDNKVGNRIDFANAISKNEKQIKGKPKVHYSLDKYKKKGSYDIMKDIPEHVTLVQFMDYLGKLNHAISVLGYWIFDSNHKREIVLNKESLDMICDPSVGEEEVTEFETVLTSARYICLDACLKKEYL